MDTRAQKVWPTLQAEEANEATLVGSLRKDLLVRARRKRQDFAQTLTIDGFGHAVSGVPRKAGVTRVETCIRLRVFLSVTIVTG